MRRSRDLPRPRSWWRASGRIAIIGAAAFVLVVIVFGRAVARFYIDALWFDSLDQSGVFWGTIRAKFTLFAIFFALFGVLAGVNLAIADRLAPRRIPPTVHPVVERFHDAFGHRLRIYRHAVTGLFAILLALPAAAQWRSWLLYRNSQSFGVSDSEFGVDVGFYVFELPFLSFVLDWLYFAVIVVILLTLVSHVLSGGVAFASPIPSASAGARGHLAVLLAVLAALKAADYWVRRYESTNARRGFVQGATYAVVHAQLPALLLLAFVAMVTAGLYLSTLRTESWRLPLISSGVWLVLAVSAGYVYPAAIQGLVVNPNQQSREAEYIERNVFATREAIGITSGEVGSERVTFETLTPESIVADLDALEDVRLLNPDELRSRFEIDQGEVAGLTIDDLDVDRYEIDGEMRQVLIAARELDLGGVPNRSWQGLHLINTRGCGLVMAPASRVLSTGRPDYAAASVELDRPELYFSPSLSGYAVAGSIQRERECEGGSEEYTGTSGVEMSSFVRRLAFGLAFMDYNLAASGAIDADSQLLWVRDIRGRVSKLAPFLSLDDDPYPVVVDGTVQWVIDAYTSTSRYPYAQAIGDVQRNEISGIPGDANYVRNSVKAVVDAYDGSVTLYVVDVSDPIVRAWMAAFPDLFTPGDAMPAELREHLRYPEDLFRVQTELYSKYQLDPALFFERQGAWSVAQSPGFRPRISGPILQQPPAAAAREESELATEAATRRFTPYYTMFGEGDDRGFVLLRPFVPFSRDDQRRALQAFMTASSDPETYGRLTVYVVENTPPGPLDVANAIESEPEISREITLQNNPESGTEVRFGDLQLMPVSDGLLWVRPFYVARQQEGSEVPVTEYRFVIVSNGADAALDATIGGALMKLYPALDGVDIGERSNVDVDPTGELSESPTSPPDDDGSPTETGGEPAEQLLARADELLREAEEQLRLDGDLGAYQDRVDEAGQLVGRALDALGGPPPTTEPEPSEPADTSG